MNRAHAADGAIDGLGGIVTDIAVPGGAVRVESLGSGPAVMFLHGWTLDRRAWEPQARALADRFHIIAVDRRGFGGSSAPPDLTREPADLIAVADRLHLDRFALVGMSQGARVALRLAISRPDRIWALIVQGAPLSGIADAGEETPLAEMRRLHAAGQVQEMRRLWRTHPLMQTADKAQRLLDRITATYDGRDLPSTASLDVTAADCAQLRMPILAITGADEGAFRHRAADLLASVTGATRLDIAGGGHLCNLDRPDDYNAALAAFLDRHAGESGSGPIGAELHRMGTNK